MKLYNTRSRLLEDFTPLTPNHLSLYTCGPTVYDFAHIGHIRAYVFNDTLRRAFAQSGYNVKHVMNITDVGHLSDDGDSGEDKMEKGARKYGKTVWDLARFYTDFFFSSMDQMNIMRPTIVCKATEHISEMVKLVQTLIQKGHAYETTEAVYFDVSTFPRYGQLSGQKTDDKATASREEVYVDPDKKNSADFVLWFKRVGKFKDHTMHWDSPWGDGFPGWHIECSAMSMKYLGTTMDIHTGGIDHIPVHHENEIAQSEAATGVPFVHYWMHYHFLQVEGQKMSKSLGNFYTIEDIKQKGFEPMALRLLLLQSHYRQPMNFTWKALAAAHEAYRKMKSEIHSMKLGGDSSQDITSSSNNEYKKRFVTALENDLQTPQALAVLFTMMKSNMPTNVKLALAADFDQVLGLNLLKDETTEPVPPEVVELAKRRIQAKRAKDYDRADKLRQDIHKLGYTVLDTKDHYTLKKN